MRRRWAAALASRGMNEEGYVHTHQHDGLAHSEGWPFPLWTQAGGIGWHFRGTGVGGYDGPPATPDGWKLSGASGIEVGEKGWEIELTEPQCDHRDARRSRSLRGSAPWLRLNWWAAGLAGANCYVEWTTQDAPGVRSAAARVLLTGHQRRAVAQRTCPWVAAAGNSNTDRVETRTMIPVYRLARLDGHDHAASASALPMPGPAQVVIKSFHTACDSRHNINNTNFIRGCHDYFLWSTDYTFLRSRSAAIRSAMRFMMREFDTRKRRCVYTTWPGHEGRSGVRYVDGKKEIVVGEGVGSNYWDLLPFGGEDALATIYYYDALRDLAELEELIAAHPEWCVATGADAFDPDDLRQHAQEVKDYGTQRFWNPQTGRFGTVDLDGNLHDYGFTFLNNEAVYYDFATPEQAQSIHAWLSWRTRRVGRHLARCGHLPVAIRTAQHDAAQRRLLFLGLVELPSRFRLATRCRTVVACWASRITI